MVRWTALQEKMRSVAKVISSFVVTFFIMDP
jgi:hypothetical protein